MPDPERVTRLYRVDEAAVLLALRPSTLRKMIASGAIAVRRPAGRSVRIPESEIIRLQRPAEGAEEMDRPSE